MMLDLIGLPRILSGGALPPQKKNFTTFLVVALKTHAKLPK